MSNASRIESRSDARAFVLGGHALFTLRSTRTDKHYTFKLDAPRDDSRTVPGRDHQHPLFLKVLTGSDNTSDFEFVGTLWVHDSGSVEFKPGRNSRISLDAPSMKAFLWAFEVLFSDDSDRADRAWTQCELWHEGRCCKCGRRLTVPTSIASGIGPECAARAAAGM